MLVETENIRNIIYTLNNIFLEVEQDESTRQQKLGSVTGNEEKMILLKLILKVVTVVILCEVWCIYVVK